MKDLKIHIDIYGRISLCEKFPDDEEYAGLQEMLHDLAYEESFHGDTYQEYPTGFYLAEFEIETETTYSWDGPDDDAYLQIKAIKPFLG